MRGRGFGPATVMTIKIAAPFAFAHHGYDVREYTPDSTDIPSDALEWAVENGYASSVDAPQVADEPAPRTRKPRAQKART